MADNRTIETESAGMRFNHSFTRKLSFYVGYQLSQSRYPEADGAPFQYGNVDIGLGYGDGLVLNFGRSTTLAMNVGVSVAKNGDPASVVRTASRRSFRDGAATQPFPFAHLVRLARIFARRDVRWGSPSRFTPIPQPRVSAAKLSSGFFFSLGAGGSLGASRSSSKAGR